MVAVLLHVVVGWHSTAWPLHSMQRSAPLMSASVTEGPYEHLRAASFDELVRAAPFFCNQLQADSMDEEIEIGLRALLGSPNGVRAFLMCWNNDPDWAAADKPEPPHPLLSALDAACTGPGPTRFMAQTMLMNIAMSTAETCKSQREGQIERAKLAMRSYKRAAILAGFISSSPEQGGISLPSALRTESVAFSEAIKAELTERREGEVDFNWSNAISAGGYDQEQLEAIAQAISLS